MTGRISPGLASSAAIRTIHGATPRELIGGWQNPSIAERQQQAFSSVIRDLRAGKIREDFKALAAAMASIDVPDPVVLEVGAGGGWNAEVMTRLTQFSFRYIGLDYAEAMIHLARRQYPGQSFVVGDAAQLPFGDASCDVLLFGTVLMHLVDYPQAIAEGRRVSRRWCIFHTVPVMQKRETLRLEKLAYGIPVVEIVFNETELTDLIQGCGFELKGSFESLPHPYLKEVLAEDVAVRTYLCRAC